MTPNYKVSDGHRTRFGDWLLNRAPFLSVDRRGSGIAVVAWNARRNHSWSYDVIRIERFRWMRLLIVNKWCFAIGKPYGLTRPKSIFGTIHCSKL